MKLINVSIIVLIVANFIDGILTMFWIDNGIASEANLLMEYLIFINPLFFLFVKMLLVILGSIILWKYSYSEFTRIMTYMVTMAYLILLGYHTLGFF